MFKKIRTIKHIHYITIYNKYVSYYIDINLIKLGEVTELELSHLIPSALSLEIQPPLQGNTEALAYRPTKSNRLLQ